MTVRRIQVERFNRFQRQFARALAHRELIEFRATLDELIERAATRAAPPSPSPAPRRSAVVTDPTARAAVDQALRDLLVRVHARPIAAPDPAEPYERVGVWWSPGPVYGFRVWQLVDGGWHGVKVPWPAPTQTAVCLYRSTDRDAPIPHDATECRKPPCGIYALKDPQRLRRALGGWSDATIGVGVAELSGRVIEHDSGWRAQRARVVGLGVIDGDERWVQLSWVEKPNDLEELFAAPERFLEQSTPQPMPAAAAVNEVLVRVAARAAALNNAAGGGP